MRKLLEQVQAALAAFVEQDRDLLLVASCSDADAPLLLQMLRDLEQASTSDLFLLVPVDYRDPESFVSAIVAQLEAEHRSANERAEQEGRPPLPALPPAMLDERRPALERMVEAFSFARSLLPPDKRHRVVWALFPQQIADRVAYARFLRALLPRPGAPVASWVAGTRIIARDAADSVVVVPELARAPATQVLPVDLGLAAAAESLCAEVEDEALPRERRMQALLSLAVLDYGFERHADATAKYNLLLGYYQETGNLALQGLVLNGIGDIHKRQGLLAEAQHWFECAVPPAAQGSSAVIFQTVVRNLGDVAFQQQDYAAAEQYYDGVDKLATHALDAQSKARALEWRGLSQERQRAYADAIASWEGAAELCRSLGMDEIRGDVLGHLERVYTQHGLRDRLEAVRAERSSLGQEAAR